MAVLHEYGVKHAYSFDDKTRLDNKIYVFLKQLIEQGIEPDNYNPEAVKKYAARNLTGIQCELFKAVLERK